MGAVLAISALSDLEPPIQATPYLNADLHISDAEVEALSPARLVPARGTRLVTAVGGLESAEFKRQTAMLGQRWAASLDCEVPLPGAHHYAACDALADPSQPLFHAALRLAGSPAVVG